MTSFEKKSTLLTCNTQLIAYEVCCFSSAPVCDQILILCRLPGTHLYRWQQVQFLHLFLFDLQLLLLLVHSLHLLLRILMKGFKVFNVLKKYVGDISHKSMWYIQVASTKWDISVLSLNTSTHFHRILNCTFQGAVDNVRQNFNYLNIIIRAHNVTIVYRFVV